MLQLDYALLCDYVRGEGGVAHVIAAGIDTIYRPEVPTVANFGFLARFTFTDEDLGQEHQLEPQLADQKGQQVARITGTLPLQPVQGPEIKCDGEALPTRMSNKHSADPSATDPANQEPSGSRASRVGESWRSV
jgi:hypothetical protein